MTVISVEPWSPDLDLEEPWAPDEDWQPGDPLHLPLSQWTRQLVELHEDQRLAQYVYLPANWCPACQVGWADDGPCWNCGGRAA